MKVQIKVEGFPNIFAQNQGSGVRLKQKLNLLEKNWLFRVDVDC